MCAAVFVCSDAASYADTYCDGSYASVVEGDGALALWRLNDSPKTVLADTLDGNRDGDYVGTPSASDPVRSNSTAPGTTFGAGAYGEVDSAQWVNTNSFTVEAWVRAPEPGGSYKTIFSRDGSTRGYALYVNSSNKLAIWTGSGSASGTATLTPGTVYHVALTSDGSGSRIYLNGLQDFGTSASSNQQANPLHIGFQRSANPFPFPGDISDAAYYGTALDQADLEAHFAAGTCTVGSAPTPTATQTITVTMPYGATAAEPMFVDSELSTEDRALILAIGGCLVFCAGVSVVSAWGRDG